MPQKEIRSQYFINLDAFRFFSFISVLLQHTLVMSPQSNMIIGFIHSLIYLNYLSVSFFFTLSAFLITYMLLAEKKGTVHLLNFYRNRILRVWPLYFIILFICYLLLPFMAKLVHGQPPSLPPVLPFLFFYANFYIIEHGSAYTSTLLLLWSIAIEEQFYLVWGVTVKFITSKHFVLVVAVLFVVSVSFSYSYLYILHKPANHLTIHSLYVLPNFCTGALIAFICVQKQKAYRLLKKLPPLLIASVYIILPVAYFFITEMIIINIIKSICYSIIIYDQAFNERRLFNAGKFAFLNYLGKISYGLYVYHALLVVVLHKLFHFFDYPVKPTLAVNLLHVSITFILSVIISHFSYQFIEKRFLALKHRAGKRFYKI